MWYVVVVGAAVWCGGCGAECFVVVYLHMYC